MNRHQENREITIRVDLPAVKTLTDLQQSSFE